MGLLLQHEIERHIHHRLAIVKLQLFCLVVPPRSLDKLQIQLYCYASQGRVDGYEWSAIRKRKDMDATEYGTSSKHIPIAENVNVDTVVQRHFFSQVFL